jgi:serine/threonine-protein kinase
MLAGYQPFAGGGTFRDDLLAIVSEPPLPLPAHVDPAICEVVEACLSKEPAGRPQGAAALERWLREVQGDYLDRLGLVERDAPI